MADTAAYLVDAVFPIVPVRQWVLSLPFALRYRMAYDASLISDVLNVFIRALFGTAHCGFGTIERLLEEFPSRGATRRDVSPLSTQNNINTGEQQVDLPDRKEFRMIPM